MNNEENTPASYGEPWKHSLTWDLLQANDGTIIIYDAHKMEEPYLTRAIKCVNACQGIADPVEALKVVIETLQGIANAKPSEWDDPTDFEAWAKSRARSTLSKLNP